MGSATCFFRVFSHGNRRVHTTTVRRGVASEDLAALKSSEEEKLKLGASELKVTRLGIGAWSWGDTSYWNNFEWDGKTKRSLPIPKLSGLVTLDVFASELHRKFVQTSG